MYTFPAFQRPGLRIHLPFYNFLVPTQMISTSLDYQGDDAAADTDRASVGFTFSSRAQYTYWLDPSQQSYVCYSLI